MHPAINVLIFIEKINTTEISLNAVYDVL